MCHTVPKLDVDAGHPSVAGSTGLKESIGHANASTLRQYLEALGARLELVAVFDDEDRRVPIHLGRDDA